MWFAWVILTNLFMMTSSNGHISALLVLCVGITPVTGGFPHESLWRWNLMFSLICAWTNGWASNRGTGDLRHHRTLYDVLSCSYSLYVFVYWPFKSVPLYPGMMTSSNGNIFHVTGPLCGEFTGTGEFPAQRPLTGSFDVFFDLRPNKRLSEQPWGW